MLVMCGSNIDWETFESQAIFDDDLLERLKAIVGPGGWKSDPTELEPHLTEWRGVYTGRTL